MNFLSSWGEKLSLIIVFALHATQILAFDLASELNLIDDYLDSEIDDVKTEFNDVKNWFEGEVGKELARGLKSIDGVLLDKSIGYSTVPPISTSLKSSGFQSHVTVGLYDANGSYPQPAAFGFAEHSYPNWNNSWFGFALDSFDAVFEVDVDLSGTASGEYTLSLLKLPIQAEGVMAEIEFQLYLTAEASTSMSFTTGLNLTLVKKAAIMMPALDPIVDLTQSMRVGFDPKDFILTPIFNASMPKLDFSVEFALRTVFSMAVEGIDIGALYLDLPAFDFTIDTLTNKMSNCKTPPVGTPSDQIYAELIQLQGKLDAKLSYELLDGDETLLDSWEIWNALDECYAFLPGLGSIGPVPASSKSAVLTAAAVTTCTTDGTTTVGAALKSLSPGTKAGAVIGTLVGVSLVAVLAWYGGRASQRHSINKRGPASAWASARQRLSRFFARGNRDGAHNLYFTSSMPVRQTNEYTGGLFRSPDTEMQTPYTYQSWQNVKEDPFVTAETITPSPADLSHGEEYDMSTPGLGQTGDMSNSPDSRSKMYNGSRTEPVEGLGLLHGESTPMPQWKEFSRKQMPIYAKGSGSL